MLIDPSRRGIVTRRDAGLASRTRSQNGTSIYEETQKTLKTHLTTPHLAGTKGEKILPRVVLQDPMDEQFSLIGVYALSLKLSSESKTFPWNFDK